MFDIYKQTLIDHFNFLITKQFQCSIHYVVYTGKRKSSVHLSDDPLCQSILSLLENQDSDLFISR